MRTYDFSPLCRSTIGFDRLFDLVETAQRATDEGYPPYNIERLGEDRYQITLAVAGFSPDEYLDHGRTERRHHRRRQDRKDRARVPLQGNFDPAFQTAIQPGGLCAGEGRNVRQRLAQDRAGPGNPRGDEAAPDRHQRQVDFGKRPSDRGQGG